MGSTDFFRAILVGQLAALDKRDAYVRATKEALRGIDSWQPIKTAPKDFTVLVGCKGSDLVVMSRLRKSSTRLTTGKFWGWDNTSLNWTHWRPIPEGPK